LLLSIDLLNYFDTIETLAISLLSSHGSNSNWSNCTF